MEEIELLKNELNEFKKAKKLIKDKTLSCSIEIGGTKVFINDNFMLERVIKSNIKIVKKLIKLKEWSNVN